MEISYRCYCACGGAENPRLLTRHHYHRYSGYHRTTYHDTGYGPLVAKP